ncbi:MAG: hypothetical protein IAG13_32260 [Deltaproteobacteria bacterium]|nr:hypothetical protein [Nannocystaceae bacterium]
MKALHFTATLLALLPAIGCIIPGDDEQNDDGGDTNGDSSASSPSTSNATTAPATDEGSSSLDSGDSGSESSGSADSTGDSGDDDSTGDPIGTCESATLHMGNPYFNGEFANWDAAGQPLLADPPLRSRHLAAVDGKIMVETQFEVWGAEDGEVRRIAGDEEEFDSQYQPSGPCADVRLLIGFGIAALPGNRLAVADTRGNGIIELTDPFGECTAAPIAGTQVQVFDADVSGGAAMHGDQDGPGAQALFFGPERLISDDAGNLYFVDSGNQAIKRIADDADRTVTTIYRYTDASPWGLTLMNGTLYVTGTTGGDDFLWSIDPDAGTREVIYEGRGLLDEVDSSQTLNMTSLQHDGTDLLVAAAKGYIFRLSTAGEPLGIIAGIGDFADFPEVDVSMPVPVAELPINSYSLNDAGFLRMGSELYITSVGGGIGFHVWSIACE